MSVWLPVIVTEPVPLLLTCALPLAVAASVPCSTESVVVIVPVASGSLIVIALAPVKLKACPSVTLIELGTVLLTSSVPTTVNIWLASTD